jgi:hypothetical protein
MSSSYSPQHLNVARKETIKFQGKGSCESPRRDKWRYASVPAKKQTMTQLEVQKDL